MGGLGGLLKGGGIGGGALLAGAGILAGGGGFFICWAPKKLHQKGLS